MHVYLNSPKMDWERPVGTVKYNYTKYELQRFADFISNVVTYALYQNNFLLAEELLKEGKCSWTVKDLLASFLFYRESSVVDNAMRLIITPNIEMIKALPKEDKVLLLTN